METPSTGKGRTFIGLIGRSPSREPATSTCSRNTVVTDADWSSMKWSFANISMDNPNSSVNYCTGSVLLMSETPHAGDRNHSLDNLLSVSRLSFNHRFSW